MTGPGIKNPVSSDIPKLRPRFIQLKPDMDDPFSEGSCKPSGLQTVDSKQ